MTKDPCFKEHGGLEGEVEAEVEAEACSQGSLFQRAGRGRGLKGATRQSETPAGQCRELSGRIPLARFPRLPWVLRWEAGGQACGWADVLDSPRTLQLPSSQGWAVFISGDSPYRAQPRNPLPV